MKLLLLYSYSMLPMLCCKVGAVVTPKLILGPPLIKVLIVEVFVALGIGTDGTDMVGTGLYCKGEVWVTGGVPT